jgi:hypothetical protein
MSEIYIELLHASLLYGLVEFFFLFQSHACKYFKYGLGDVVFQVTENYNLKCYRRENLKPEHLFSSSWNTFQLPQQK